MSKYVVITALADREIEDNIVQDSVLSIVECPGDTPAELDAAYDRLFKAVWAVESTVFFYKFNGIRSEIPPETLKAAKSLGITKLDLDGLIHEDFYWKLRLTYQDRVFKI